MRAQTPSYVVSTRFCYLSRLQNIEKSFRISSSAYNEALNFGLQAAKPSSWLYYQELLEHGALL